MYAVDFEFDGRRLSDFGCIMTSFNGIETNIVESGASATFITANSSGSDIYNVFSSSYDAPFSATFTIIKDPCATSSRLITHNKDYFKTSGNDILIIPCLLGTNYDDPYFTPAEANLIQSWLCRRTDYCKFKILNSGYDNYYWNGWFSSHQHMMGDHIAGFELVFTADAPYAYHEDITTTYTCTANTAFVIDSASYEEGYIIPSMVITCKAAGDLSIINQRDNKPMIINNCANNEVITIDGKTLYIESSRAAHDLTQDFNFYYPRIFTSYANKENLFQTSLACTIEVTYAPAIKVGF